jgi:hypothetical protein
MSTFTALLIDPYAQTATIVDLLSTPPQSAAPLSFEALVNSNQLYGFAAQANKVPIAHWPLLAPLVHAQRGDNNVFADSETLDLGVRLIYRHTTFRGMLWTRDDMPLSGTPQRDAIPGFKFRDSVQPGIWWQGCCVLVLYERENMDTHSNRAFLEVTARAAISWEREPGVPQTSRMRLSLGDDGDITSSTTVPACAQCNEYINAHPKRCAACQRVYYCAVTCQRAHWPTHKSFCRLVSQAVPQAVPHGPDTRVV